MQYETTMRIEAAPADVWAVPGGRHYVDLEATGLKVRCEQR